MAHSHEVHGPVYPMAPRSFDIDAQRTWSDLIRILREKDSQTLIGVVGNGEYTVSGTIPVSSTIDLGSVTLTATAETLAKLLNDLADGGILKIIHL